MLRRHLLWRSASILGPEASENADILVDPQANPEKLIDCAWKFIRQRLKIDYLCLRWALGTAQISQIAKLQGAECLTWDVVPYLQLNDWKCWEDLYGTVKSKHRREDRRRLKVLSAKGEVAFRDIQSHEEANEVLDWIFTHKKEWLERANVISPWLVSPDYKDFLKKVCRDCLSNGTLCMRTLCLDNRILAAKMSFIVSDTIECMLATYDREYLQFGPGRQLINDALRLAYNKNPEDIRL